MKFISGLLVSLILLLPLSAFAEIPKEIAADFSPASGYIIMPIGDEFLVDLDAAANLQEGDILTLVMPGEKVIHPVTKEILGTLEMPKGYLQVTRIKSGYSYAKLLFSDVPPEKGNQIKRFEQVPTLFLAQDKNLSLSEELRNGLPQLNWLKENSTKTALLTFELANKTLSVKNSSGTVLRTYQYTDGKLSAPLQTVNRSAGFTVDADPARNKGFLNKTVNNLIDSVGLGMSKKDPFGPSGIIRKSNDNSSVWMGNNIEGNPAGLAVADFNNDGIQETVIAFENRIAFLQIQNGSMKEVASIEMPAGKKLLSLDAIDLDNNGTPELYLTACKDYDLASLAIEFNGSKFEIFQNNRRWYFRATELPGEGRVLLAQVVGDETDPFWGNPFRVVRSGSELNKGKEFDLLTHASLFSFSPLDSTDNTGLIAYISSDDYLKVSSSTGTELWESNDYFGGSEAAFYAKEEGPEEEIAPLYIQKRIINTSGGEIIVAQNDGLRALKRFRKFTNSRIAAFTWNGFALQESWRTTDQSGYLADFAIADADNDGEDELVMAITFKHETILNKARSTVVIYELD